MSTCTSFQLFACVLLFHLLPAWRRFEGHRRSSVLSRVRKLFLHKPWSLLVFILKVLCVATVINIVHMSQTVQFWALEFEGIQPGKTCFLTCSFYLFYMLVHKNIEVITLLQPKYRNKIENEYFQRVMQIIIIIILMVTVIVIKMNKHSRYTKTKKKVNHSKSPIRMIHLGLMELVDKK